MSSEPLDYHDALRTLLDTHAPLTRQEDVPLAQLAGRILARDVEVRHDVPAFDNSAMDGYAVCGNDRAGWRVVHRIAAGDAGARLSLQPGEAARIFTGAPVPQGATAVVMQEKVSLDAAGSAISLDADAASEGVAEGLNIRRRAEELRRGALLLASHQPLGPAAVGLLAAQGYTRAACLAPLRVTVFSSGNELVEPGQPLGDGQIHDSNRYMLAALLRAQGYTVTDGGILPDKLDATRAALRQASGNTDAILCSGGVSVGEEDHLKTALAEAGELTQWRLFIKPGKPFTWGRIGDCRVFMLPGNPVSSLVTSHMLALPALRRLAGLPPALARPWQLRALAGFTRERPEPRREFMRVMLRQEDGGHRVVPTSHQGSAMLSGTAFAQALAEIPPGARVQPGEPLTVYPLTDRF